MTAGDNEKLLRRIRKLMALGTRNNNAYEAARAVRLAQVLMQRHDLSPEDLALGDVQEAVSYQIYSDAISIPGWLNALAAVVCMATGCRCWFSWHHSATRTGQARRRRSLHFYGLNERPEVGLYVFTVLSRQLREATVLHMHSTYRLKRLKVQTKRNRADQFREGWVVGVWNVLESFEPSEKESGVLRNWLTQRCGNQALSELNVREARSCCGDSKARESGWMAGRQAQLSRGLNGQASHLKALSVIGGKDDE
ncbi:DUF2786 domain-containing protein [Dickeya dianthicola]|uniref:DUF2786 domain-containing protein n=1 Tax=Dickeya dianthicola TaxID=204039 RepID=UPI001F6171ED|nr:DUF2786 domain-containing protein [Dickeya dianthicola]MCI4185344.1 DUF2786 domain-containing protein [Dickeya dianthicola]